MTRKIGMRAVLAAGIIGVALTGAGKRQEIVAALSGAILTEKEAFVPLLPEVIVPGGTQQVIPSPTGDFVLVKRAALAPTKSPFPEENPPKWAELSLVLWNASSRRTTTLWRKALTENNIDEPVGVEAIEEIDWLPKSGVAFVQFVTVGGDERPTTRRLMIVDAARGTLRGVADMTTKDNLIVAPDRPFAALVRHDKRALQIIGANGVPGGFVLLSDPMVYFFGWMPDGKTLFGLRPPPPEDAPEAERKKSRWALADIATGAVTSLEKRPKIGDAAPPPSPLLTIRAGRAALKESDTTADVSPLWLEGATKEAVGRVLLAPDGDQPVLLPNAALYRRHGTLFAVPILRMDRATYAKLQTETQRRETLSNAKQIGLALMMYCQDYDENFPPPGDGKSIAEVADPYLKNISVFNDVSTGKFGFTPAYKSTSLTSFDNPSTTPLGYLSGPGGRVIIFVDGHVAWE